MVRRPMSSLHRERITLSVALVSSGAAALIYESAWGRMLNRVFGVSDWAIATVLAAFFLGMGIGAHAGGRVARRISNPIRFYALLEVGVAIWALASIVAIPAIHRMYAALGPHHGFAALSAIRFAIALAILLPPTIAMGATLPLLVRRFESLPTWHDDATRFYAVNTLGAAVGAGLTGFFLLPTIGIRLSIALAACSSVLAAIIAMVGIPRSGREPLPEPTEPSDVIEESASIPDSTVVVLAFGSGALSLAGEVLFTRLLRTVIHGTSQAFAAMLVTYLVGITLGSFIARRGRPGLDSLRRFGVAQLLAGLAIIVAIGISPSIPRLVGLMSGSGDLVPHEVPILVGIAMLLLLPLATAVGTGLPAVMSLVERSGGSHAAGRVLGANTFGGLAGSLLAGFAAVPAIGLEASLYSLVVLHAALALVALVVAAGTALDQRITALLATFAVAISLFVLRPSIELPFLLDARSEGTRSIVEGAGGYDEHQVVFLREGRNTTVSVLSRNDMLLLFNDGRPESGIGDGNPPFGPELLVLGSLGPLLAEHRDRAMVVGLGAGHTTSTLRAGGFEQVDVVELEPAIIDAARTLHRMRNVPFPLDDREHVHVIFDDARAQLSLADAGSYDAVVSQPSHPWLSGASALYTREFVAEAKRALKPGGVLALWTNVFRMDVAHLRDIVATVRSELPHVAAFMVEDSSFLLVASARPLAFGDRMSARLSSAPRLREMLTTYEIDTTSTFLGRMELDETGTAAFARGGRILVDDRPELEYALSAIPHEQSLQERDIDVAFRGIPWISGATSAALPRHIAPTLPLYRLAKLEGRRIAVSRVKTAIDRLPSPQAERLLLEGGVREMLGDVRGALAAYDASGDPEALARADSLRAVDGSPAEALAIARARSGTPNDGTALLRAAFSTRRREDLELAVAIAGRAPLLSDPAYSTLARAFLGQGCEGAANARVSDTELDAPALAFLADCVASTGDADRAARLRQAWALRLRADAAYWYERGKTAADGGNDALAIRFYRRTLRMWPAHAEAAEALATALCALDRCMDATPVLDSAIEALRFSPGHDRPLRRVASRLGIRLGR